MIMIWVSFGQTQWGCLLPSSSAGFLPRERWESLWWVLMLLVKQLFCTSWSLERSWLPFLPLVCVVVCIMIISKLKMGFFSPSCSNWFHMLKFVFWLFCLGFNVETVEYKNISFTVWDVGGQDKVFADPSSTLLNSGTKKKVS